MSVSNKAKDVSGLKFITNQLKIVNHIKICEFPHSQWMSQIFSNDYMFDQKDAVSRTFQESLSRKARQFLEEYPPPAYDPNQQNIDNPFDSTTLMTYGMYLPFLSTIVEINIVGLAYCCVLG